MKSFISLSIYGIVVCFVLACNAYIPFNSNTSDLDKLEEGQKCLKDSDYVCAIAQYKEIKNTHLKNEKLCQLYLTKGGLTLHILVNTLNKNSGTVLSNLANALMPWSVAKSEDFDSAISHCAALSASSGNNAVFLKTVGAFSHCAFRMAKADLIRATSESTCNVTGQSDGHLTSSDIGGDGTGAVNAGNPGMCKVDVDACRDDFSILSASELSGAGYSDLAGAINKLPAGITDAATNVVRGALRGTF